MHTSRQRQPVSTCLNIGRSIWKSPNYDEFRTRAGILDARTKGSPSDSRAYSTRQDRQIDDWIPFATEQELADGLAFILVDRDGAKTVAAATLERGLNILGVTIRVARNEGFSAKVEAAFRNICSLLERCASEGFEARFDLLEKLADNAARDTP